MMWFSYSLGQNMKLKQTNKDESLRTERTHKPT